VCVCVCVCARGSIDGALVTSRVDALRQLSTVTHTHDCCSTVAQRKLHRFDLRGFAVDSTSYNKLQASISVDALGCCASTWCCYIARLLCTCQLDTRVWRLQAAWRRRHHETVHWRSPTAAFRRRWVNCSGNSGNSDLCAPGRTRSATYWWQQATELM